MIHYIIKHRLMFPEPEDSGSGGAAPEENATPAETPAEPQQTEDVNPFEAAFGEDDTEEEAQQTEEDADYSLGIGADDGFDDDEVVMLTSLCKKHNLPADSAAAFLKEVYNEADKRSKTEERQSFNAATKELQEKWGADFQQNAKKAGTMIRQIGGRLGWTEDKMKSMLNPHDIEMMHEFARYVGNSATRGLQQTAPVVSKKESVEDMESRRKALILENLNARTRGDLAAMKRTSDEHFDLTKKLKGDKAYRLLPSGS